MAQNAKSAGQTGTRKAFVIGVVAVAVLLVGGWIAWSMLNAFGMIDITASLSAPSHSVVGGASDVTLTVTNRGSDIRNLVINVNTEGRDNWFDHHAVTARGACVPNKSHGRFECGSIPKGVTRSFVIRSTATDAGTFDYIFNYEDDRGDRLNHSARMQNSWSEQVRT